MEGVTNEAGSLAGHWGLGKLIAFYDSNEVTIDGHTDITFTEDVMGRYAALGWHTQRVPWEQYGDFESLRRAIKAAQQETGRPSVIQVCSRYTTNSIAATAYWCTSGSSLAGMLPVRQCACTLQYCCWDTKRGMAYHKCAGTPAPVVRHTLRFFPQQRLLQRF